MSGKPRVISADLTPLVKWGLPCVFLAWGIWFVAKWVAWLHDGATIEPFVGAAGVCFVTLCPLIAARCLALKRVALSEDALHISNHRREIVVPLRDVERVTENRWESIHPVTIHLRSDTEFGSRIVFMPHRRWFAWWTSHPVVAELREAVERAGGMSGAARQPEPRPIG